MVKEIINTTVSKEFYKKIDELQSALKIIIEQEKLLEKNGIKLTWSKKN
jgi:hypothetical protein